MDFQSETGRIFLEDEYGRLLAEVTFPSVSARVADIRHTFVDESLRGQGVAGQLMEAAARQIRAEGKKARLTCSYAAAWFPKHPEYADLVTDGFLE